jgi:YVTN family beta-propeller protein
MGRRLALLIATYQYEDAGLRQLTAPAHDAESLAAVLQDPDIAGFEVTILVNEPHYRVGEAIGEFYRNRRRDDLTLLYFTGHGLKDADGRLYLAMTNTRRDSLLFTSLSAEQIDQAMTGCASRQKVLVLDCCYSGAFPAGRIAKADPEVHALERFQGRGRTVLTASDATQYSFEGNQVHGEATQSVFTHYVVAGLRDGSADLDGDGDITIDELYGYVYERVVEEMPQQRPKKQDNVEGRTVIARNVNWELPAYLRHAIASPIAADRLAAVEGLAHLHRIGNDVVRGRVREEIRRLGADDSKQVSTAAAERLRELLPSPEPAPEPPTRQAPVDSEPQAETVSEPSPVKAPAPPPGTPPSPAVSAGPEEPPAHHSPATDPPAQPATDVQMVPGSGTPEPLPSRRPPSRSRFSPSRLTDLVGARIKHERAPAKPTVPIGARHRRRTIMIASLTSAILLTAIGAVITVRTAKDGTSGSVSTGRATPLLYGVALSPNGRRLYISRSQGVSVVDTATNRTVGNPISAPSDMYGVAASPDGDVLYLPLPNSRSVSVLDTATNTMVGDPIAVPGSPVDVAASPNGRRIYVGLKSAVSERGPGSVAVIDAKTKRLIGSQIGIGNEPSGVAVSPDGRRLYVTHFNADGMSVIDTAKSKIVGSPIAVGDLPSDVTVSPDGHRIYVASFTSDRLSAMDAETNRLVGPPITVREPSGMAVSPDGRRLYVSSYSSGIVSVVDTEANKIVANPIVLGP